jgi:hypothetical protein
MIHTVNFVCKPHKTTYLIQNCRDACEFHLDCDFE